MLSRRGLLQAGMGAMAFLALRRKAFAFSQSPKLTKFPAGWDLQGLGPNGIPVASPDATGMTYGSTKVTRYTIDAKAYTQKLHPDLPATPLWGYGQNGNHRHLGGVIVVNKNQPIQVRVNNLLTGDHPVKAYFDRGTRFPDCLAYPDNRIQVHLHGGLIPWISDGGPDGWFGPNGGWAGSSYACDPQTLLGNGTGAQLNSRGYSEYYWPNQQSMRMMWYHDHAHDQTRLSAYGGLASAYIIRDDLENMLIRSGALPSREVPLAFQDKVFNDGTGVGARGSLWYPSIYEPDASKDGRWRKGPVVPLFTEPLPIPSCVPEFYGDTILCNGTAYPNVAVAPRRYRFRVLNAFQAKFMNVNFIVVPNSGIDLPLVQNDKPPFDNTVPLVPVPVVHLVPDVANLTALKIIQIGTEGGLLKAPVTFNPSNKPVACGFDPITGNVTRYNLLLAPAERADILVDFNNLPQGTKVLMYTDAPSPFPGGDPRNDYFVGMEDFTAIAKNPSYGLFGGSAPPVSGFGPDTRSLALFTVGSGTGLPADMAERTMLAVLTQQMAAAFTTLGQSGVPTTELSLNEDFDEAGRLTQKLGVVIPGVLGGRDPNPLFFINPLTSAEVYNNHETRMWRIWNMTGDTHPIHFHLVNVQVVKRQLFGGVTPDITTITGISPVMNDAGGANPIGVDTNEVGWKETVRINPFEVVTVIMKFDLPVLPFAMPLSTSDPLAGAGAHEYVWHCHILEHEEHDMMRTFLVRP